MARPDLAAGERLVVKIGTSSLVDASGAPDESRLEALCEGLFRARSAGIHVVLVSSGAIAAGLEPLGLAARPSDIPSLQAAAAVGQGRLLRYYDRLLRARGMTTAQVLLTRYDFMQRQQYVNARNTIDRLLALDALPIVNENDTIAVDEIRFGDNDRLAALVSNLVRARVLLLLTDRDGLHAADPRRDPDAPVLDEVQTITPELERAAGGRGSDLARGGMASKLTAAWVATFSGVGVVVANAKEPDVVARVARGERIGTYFHPRSTRHSARRLWIAFGQPPRGSIVVDPGARRALVEEKRSLLAVGVVDARGGFEAGNTVDVATTEGAVIGRGLVRFSGEELQSARGRSSADLGGREVIHRDELVIFDDRPGGGDS